MNSIKAHLTPPYYPELNAVEMVFSQWKDNFNSRQNITKLNMRDDIINAIESKRINTNSLFNHTIKVINNIRQKLMEWKINTGQNYQFLQVAGRSTRLASHTT